MLSNNCIVLDSLRLFWVHTNISTHFMASCFTTLYHTITVLKRTLFFEFLKFCWKFKICKNIYEFAKFQNSSQGIIFQKVITKKLKEVHIVCHSACLAHKMNTVLQSFQIISFGPNRLTLYLMIDKALDTTLLKSNRSGSAASFLWSGGKYYRPVLLLLDWEIKKKIQPNTTRQT